MASEKNLNYHLCRRGTVNGDTMLKKELFIEQPLTILVFIGGNINSLVYFVIFEVSSPPNYGDLKQIRRSL